MLYLTDCLYCNRCALWVDGAKPELIVGRDFGGPCDHLTLIHASFRATDPKRADVAVPQRSADWMWTRDGGTRRITADAADRLKALFEKLGGHRPRGHEILKASYWANTRCHDDVRVMVRLYGDSPHEGGRLRWLNGVVRGWSLYSDDPAALEAEIGQLLGRRDWEGGP